MIELLPIFVPPAAQLWFAERLGDLIGVVHFVITSFSAIKT